MTFSVKLQLFLLSMFLLLSGCMGKLATESGAPEVTVPGVNKQTVLDAIAAWSASKGHSVIASNDYGLTTQGLEEGPIVNFFAKTIYTVVKKDSSIKIYASQSVLTDKTSSEKIGEDKHGLDITTSKTVGREERQLMKQDDYDRIQAKLEAIKAFILTQ